MDGEGSSDVDMLYDYKTRPSWYLSILLGTQHFLTMCVPNALVTLLLINNLCLEKDASLKSELISISFFVMGITTLLQSLIGTRLPIIQGSTFALLLPTMGLLKMPELSSCNITTNPLIQARFTNQTMPESVFHFKMRLIGGAIMSCSCVELFLGASGLVKYLVRIISPLTLAAIYTVLALSIVNDLINMMALHWAISLGGTFIMIVTIVILAPIPFKVPCWSKKNGCKRIPLKIFEISPILISIAIVWGLCGILTVSGALPSDPSRYGYQARTDLKLKAMYEAKVFKMPYPMRWGWPMVVPSAIVGMSAGVLISVIESVGDYMLTAEICKAPKIPEFAICRGIFIEGLGVFLSGLLGSSVGPTSYSDNIGVLKITRAGNRVIAQVAAVIMLLCGVSPMVGALFVSIPDPAVGGVLVIITMMIIGVGITYLQYVNLKSIRNGLIFSISIAFGIFIPQWSQKHSQMISLGYAPVDETIRLLLSIGMFIATVLSVFLDNVLPGTYQIPKTIEIESLQKDETFNDEMEQMLAYDSFILKWLSQKMTCLQKLPLFPPYKRLEQNRITDGNTLDLLSLEPKDVRV